MAKVMLKADQKEELAIFSRGSDLKKYRILRRIMSKDDYRVWYVRDFLDIANEQTVRKILEQLTAEGYVRKFNSYPKFWRKIIS